MGLVINDGFGGKYNGYYKDMKDAELGSVPLPDSYKGKKVNSMVRNSVRGYGIVKGAKNPEAGAYFIRYFTDYKYYEESGINVFKNKDVEKTYMEQCKKITKTNKPNVDMSGQIWDGFEADFSSYVFKGSSAQVDTIVDSHTNDMEKYVKTANDILSKLK